MKKTLTLLCLCVALVFAPACAGNLKVDPAIEAYTESGGQKVGAVGVRLPGFEVDSDGVVVGPLGKSTAEKIAKAGADTKEAAATQHEGMTFLAWALIILGGILSLGVIVVVLALILRKK